MKLLSWNVNGLRALLRKGGFSFLNDENAEILCLQEIRAQPEQVGGILPEYPFQYWNPGQRAGYSGTASFSKIEALEVRRGMGNKRFAGEGRLLTLTYPDFHLVNVYTPNAQRGLQRLGGFARMLIGALEEIGRVVGNWFRVAGGLFLRIWNAIPQCIRDPFVDWFIPLILRNIPRQALIRGPRPCGALWRFAGAHKDTPKDGG